MDLLKNYGLLGVAAVLGAVGVYFGANVTDATQGYDLIAFLLAGLAFCAQITVVNHRYGALATSVLAAGCNAYLLYRKFDATGNSACNISQTLNCDTVNMSAASELFGLPVTLYGLAFYIGLGLASLGSDERSPAFNQINGLFAIVSLAFSAYLGWEAKKLGAFCILCITIYACNGLLLWAAFAGLKKQGKSLFSGFDKVFGTSTLWIVTGAFAIITLIGASSWNAKQVEADPLAGLRPSPKPPTPAPEPHGEGDGHDHDHPHPAPTPAPTGEVPAFGAERLAQLYSLPKGEIILDGTEPLLGDPNAAIEVVEFADYGCPHCAMAAPMLKEIVKTLPGVQLKFKAFPLSGACNPALEGEAGVERCKAAMAAECAGAQGKYFDLAAILFDNLNARTDAELAGMASQTEGLDFAGWEQCMMQESTIRAVVDDAVAGLKAGVQGTPTLYVRGLVERSEWVEITAGPEALAILIQSKADGMELLPATPSP